MKLFEQVVDGTRKLMGTLTNSVSDAEEVILKDSSGELFNEDGKFDFSAQYHYVAPGSFAKNGTTDALGMFIDDTRVAPPANVDFETTTGKIVITASIAKSGSAEAVTAIPDTETFTIKDSESETFATATFKDFTDGSYTIEDVPFGEYTLEVSADSVTVDPNTYTATTVITGNGDSGIEVAWGTDGTASVVYTYALSE